MKKLFICLMVLSAICFAGCEKLDMNDSGIGSEQESVANQQPSKSFTFTVKGDFGAATFTRAYLQADGQSMTDLWVFDFVDGICVQTVHQNASDEGWGQPQMSLQYGQHHIYFVASRGDSPTVDADGHTIVWDIPRDTFWKDYEVSVTNTSNGNRAVTLDRVATKLRITANDEVPEGCASVSVTPASWYYGINYTTGAAVSNQQKERTVQVPASYVGTSGQLVINIFGISGSDEWTTSLAIQAKDGNGHVIGSATINGAPFKRNRATEYSGNLFVSNGILDAAVNQEWESSVSGTW